VILALQHARALFLCHFPASRSGAIPKIKNGRPEDRPTFGENINEGELLVWRWLLLVFLHTLRAALFPLLHQLQGFLPLLGSEYRVDL
jgi:hypothetical protein